MAILINGTSVISDARKLENITDATGGIGHWAPSPSTITNNINFTTPFMTCTLTAATTFTESGYVEGKSALLILDTSTNAYTPTFSSNLNWDGNTEPTWSSYRYWLVRFYCAPSNEIRGSAVGYTSQASPPTETISLEGTTSVPESFFDMGSGAQDMVMGWTFNSDGNVYKYENIYNVGGSGTYLHSSTTWDNITPSTTYYIRVSNYADNTLSTTDSATLNSWLALTTTRTFRYRDSRTLTSYADEQGTMKVEIASDSGGSNILATGYYECRWAGTA
jgi:hypothetical protein